MPDFIAELDNTLFEFSSRNAEAKHITWGFVGGLFCWTDTRQIYDDQTGKTISQ